MLSDSSDGRIDRNGAIAYNQYDRVRVETTWKTRLEKERDLRRSNFDAGATGSFQMNFANCSANGGCSAIKHSHNRLETVTEKEHKQSPQARSSLQGMDSESIELQVIKHIAKKPTEKWDLPVTASQESGWLIANPVAAASLRLQPPSEPKHKGKGWAKPGRASDFAPRRARDLNSAPTVVAPIVLNTPANLKVLERIKSAPTLPQGRAPEELRHLNSRRWYRPKASCDVTQYAEAFVTMNHTSPYSNKAR